MSKEVKYFKNANWAAMSGSFTPDELREIADKIEKDYKEFNKSLKKRG